MAGTHGPIEEQHKRQMREIGQALDIIFNGPKLPGKEKEVGFCLLVFRFGDMAGGRVNYLSNAERLTMVEAMEELLSRFKGTHPEEQVKPPPSPKTRRRRKP